MWNQTKATKLLDIQYPILLGPFGGGMSTVELTAVVSNMGGLGGFGAYTLSPQEIYDFDKKINAATDRSYNLNLWVSDTDAVNGTVTDQQFENVKSQFKKYFDEAGVAMPEKPPVFKSRFEDQVQAVLDIKPKVFSFMFGIPSQFILDECRKRNIKLVGAATTLDEAIALDNAGVDMIIASGFEAGGHRPTFLESAEQSTTGTFVLIQLIREKVKTPIIAAGGIATGRGIVSAMTLGADAVMIGTAFLACDESGALQQHKDTLFTDRTKTTMLSRAFTGRLGRGITTELAKDLVGAEKNILPFPLQTTFMSVLRKAALEKKKHDMVLFWAGQIAPILKHRKAADLMKSLIEEANELSKLIFMNKICLVIIVAMVATGCYRDLRDPRDRFFTIGIKESIHSKILKEDRPFFVYVPPYSSNSGKKFPVLYLLDGEAHFHSMSGLIQILGTGVNGTKVVPEMIVVAIPNTNRTRDLTPTHSVIMEGEEHEHLKSSGGGDQFLQFIKTELIPYIDKSYPTTSNRTLVGHSFGGIAAINALYTIPETFDAYIVIDPSFWWDNQLLLKRADSIFSTAKYHNKYLYLAQANTLDPGTETNEHFGAIKEYVKVLESPKNTSRIRWAYKYYPDDSHGSVPFISEYDGLRFLNGR